MAEAYPQRDNVYFALLEERITAPEKWSAENPALYTLVLTLRDAAGKLAEARSCKVGFRDVRLRGREMLVNGVPVKLCGVNRHDHDQYGGKTVSARIDGGGRPPYETAQHQLRTARRTTPTTPISTNSATVTAFMSSMKPTSKRTAKADCSRTIRNGLRLFSNA